MKKKTNSSPPQEVCVFTDDLKIIPKTWNWSKAIKYTSLFGGRIQAVRQLTTLFNNRNLFNHSLVDSEIFTVDASTMI